MTISSDIRHKIRRRADFTCRSQANETQRLMTRYHNLVETIDQLLDQQAQLLEEQRRLLEEQRFLLQLLLGRGQP